MAKIIYFAAGDTLTPTERDEIDLIQPFTEPPFKLTVVNAQESNSYGYGPMDADFIAGTPPAPYDNLDPNEGTVYPVFDPEKPPVPVLDTQVVVNDGDTFTVAGGTVSAAVAAGVVTMSYTPD